MPASFIFATARGRPEQVEGRGTGQESGRRSRVGANQGGFVGRSKSAAAVKAIAAEETADQDDR